MASERPWFLDATVPSNFASTGSIGRLVELIERPAVVPAVRDELGTGRESGHEFRRDALGAVGADVELVAVAGDSERSTIRQRLDPGEHDSVRAAVKNGGVLATDDSAARAIARDLGVEVTGSAGSLVLGIEREALDVETADRGLDTWRRERSCYSSIDRISEVLEE